MVVEKGLLKAQERTGAKKRKQSNKQYLYVSKDGCLREELEKYKHENFDEIKKFLN